MPAPQRIRRGLLALLVVASVAQAGCLDGGPDRYEQAAEIEPGSFAEVNLEMEADDTLSFSWSTETGGQLGFDVHSHEGSRVVVHQRATGPGGSGTFTAPSSGTFSLMWENTGNRTLPLAFALEGAFEVVSFHG